MRRTNFLAAIAVSALAGLAQLFPAHAATVTVNLSTGSTGCTYTRVTGDKDGNMSFDCETSAGPSAGTLRLRLTGSSSVLVTSGTTTFVLERFGATTGGGGASGVVSVTGGCTLQPLGGTAVTFADGVNSSTTYTLGAGTAAAGSTCTVQLSNVQTAATGTSSLTVSVTGSTPPPPSGSCPAFNGRVIVWTGSQIKVDPLNTGSPVAIEVDVDTYPLITSKVYLMSVITPPGANVVAEMESSLSLCPGDWNGIANYGARCGSHSFPPQSFRAALGRELTLLESFNTCKLPQAGKFYLNIRPTKLDGSGASSCPGANCPVYVNVSR